MARCARNELRNCMKPEKFQRQIQQQAATALRTVMEQREEILRAFVAKYGFEPDEAVQIETRLLDGSRWHVEKQVPIVTPELLEMSAEYITALRRHTNLGDSAKDILPGQLLLAAEKLRNRRIKIV